MTGRDPFPWDTVLGNGTEGGSVETALTALGRLPEARALLDDAERRLIDEARRQGATWAQVATALDLASRQAAEQRRFRLGRAAATRQRTGDTDADPAVTAVRTAVSTLIEAIDLDSRWQERFSRATLARDTLRVAAPAPPGALFDLAGQALDDVDAAAPDRLPRSIRAALDTLRRAVDRARPTPGAPTRT